jgi:vacuole morphology and inheritance protein 14
MASAVQDLEFASLMVVKLNMILITSPELAEFRKRLKNIESKVSRLNDALCQRDAQSLSLHQDGQMLFISIYKSWCHNAVAVFALCLLAQAYEHASSLLQTL